MKGLRKTVGLGIWLDTLQGLGPTRSDSRVWHFTWLTDGTVNINLSTDADNGGRRLLQRPLEIHGHARAPEATQTMGICGARLREHIASASGLRETNLFMPAGNLEGGYSTGCGQIMSAGAETPHQEALTTGAPLGGPDESLANSAGASGVGM